jgi:hypothetical protein
MWPLVENLTVSAPPSACYGFFQKSQKLILKSTYTLMSLKQFSIIPTLPGRRLQGPCFSGTQITQTAQKTAFTETTNRHSGTTESPDPFLTRTRDVDGRRSLILNPYHGNIYSFHGRGHAWRGATSRNSLALLVAALVVSVSVRAVSFAMSYILLLLGHRILLRSDGRKPRIIWERTDITRRSAQTPAIRLVYVTDALITVSAQAGVTFFAFHQLHP